MVNDYIQDEFDAPLMQTIQHFLKVFHRAVARKDGAVVTHIITIVDERRVEEWVHPNHGDTKTFEIVQLFDDAAEIAEPITVSVVKTLGVNLVKDTFFPPGFFFGAMYVSYALGIIEALLTYAIGRLFYDTVFDLRIVIGYKNILGF